MQRIRVTTYFDCTQTNTTSYRKIKNSNTFTTAEEWDYSRNQQRNFETILQNNTSFSYFMIQPIKFSYNQSKLYFFTVRCMNDSV